MCERERVRECVYVCVRERERVGGRQIVRVSESESERAREMGIKATERPF